MILPIYGSALALLSLGLMLLQGLGGHRQGLYAALGMSLLLFFTWLHYGRLRPAAPGLYLASVVALALVMVPGLGQSANGAQRWLSLGPLGALQPSELAKLGLILWLARSLSERERPDGKCMVKALCAMAIPFLLTMTQPDLGTACMLLFICLAMLFVAGGSAIYLGGLVIGGLAAVPHVLRPYQRNRLLVFLDPEHDSQGLGYNLVQSKTAIGSGGWWGAGVSHGPMSQGGFVPENHTDFLFTVVGEELGFVGCLGIVLLFGLLLLALGRVARRATDRFGALLVVGVAAMLGFQGFINMAMTTGLLPAVGIPLPLLSQGGTSLWMTLSALGMASSVARQAQRRGPAAASVGESWNWAA